MLVSCDAPAEKSGKTASDYDAITKEMGTNKWSYSDLKAMVMNLTGKTSRTAERKITDLADAHRIVKNSDGTYSTKSIEIPEYFHD